MNMLSHSLCLCTRITVDACLVTKQKKTPKNIIIHLTEDAHEQ